MTSAHADASDGVFTVKPCSSAFARLVEPSLRPMTISTPESRRFSACAWPCEP